MIDIITSGRIDTESFFSKSGLREFKKLNHTPILVFVPLDDNKLKVEIVNKPRDLLNFPDQCKAMAQWQGKWDSDFFQFTIGELKEYIKNNPPKENQNI